jgi:hypothetical protein
LDKEILAVTFALPNRKTAFEKGMESEAGFVGEIEIMVLGKFERL